MTDNVTHLPEPGIILDLDTLERDSSEVKAPFVVKVGGKRVTFADPADVPWQDLATVNIPADLMRVSLAKEDAKHILDERALPLWKFQQLMKAYYDHYDMEDKIREAKRQASISGF